MIARLWSAYLTLFVIACAVTVGIIIGTIINNSMALNEIAKLEKANKAAILERGR